MGPCCPFYPPSRAHYRAISSLYILIPPAIISCVFSSSVLCLCVGAAGVDGRRGGRYTRWDSTPTRCRKTAPPSCCAAWCACLHGSAAYFVHFCGAACSAHCVKTRVWLVAWHGTIFLFLYRDASAHQAFYQTYFLYILYPAMVGERTGSSPLVHLLC